jgi:glycerate 2-kinase
MWLDLFMADLKELARRIFLETLSAIDISAAMQRKLRRQGTVLFCGDCAVDLRAFAAVQVVAIGKAAHAMVEGLSLVLTPDVPIQGIVSAPITPPRPLAGMRYFLSGHPIPSAASWAAAEAILSLLKTCDERTLVIFLLSGGGSSLVELPLDRALTLEDVRILNRVLVNCGASIDEINTVRKHLSAVKGGRLAVAAELSTKITIAVSDVPAGREAALTSGPTLADPTTNADARQIIRKYSLLEKLPVTVQKWLADGMMPETPKAGNPAFAKSQFVLLLGTDDLFHPAHHAAEAAGCVSCCDNTTDDWPVAEAAENLLGQLEELRAANPGSRVALIADGELSSPVTGDGIGGRNSAFVLACVERIAGRQIAVLSAGTDGIDGNSPAAGAVADGETLARARAGGMEPADAFRRSDAYTFFSRLNDALVTGPTGNNLRDLRILIAEP